MQFGRKGAKSQSYFLTDGELNYIKFLENTEFKCLSQYKGKSLAFLVHVFDSDIVPFETRAPQRQLESRIEAKFCTFDSYKF